MDLPTAFLATAIGYLLGSISFARLVTRLAAPSAELANLEVPVAGTDEKPKINIYGANSASMILGPRLGCLVAVLDMLKVALPMLVLRLCYPGQAYFLLTSVAGLVGHNWPVYHRFQGGRGFSVMLGSFAVVDWLGALVTPAAGMLLGIVVVGDPAFGYAAWVWLMIPWLWFRTYDPIYLAYAIAVNLLFMIGSLPEIRLHLKYRREGKLEAYRQGLMESSPQWRGIKKIADRLNSRKK